MQIKATQNIIFFFTSKISKFYKLDNIHIGKAMGKQVLSHIVGGNMNQYNL